VVLAESGGAAKFGRIINTFRIYLEQSFWMWKVMVVLKRTLIETLKYRSVYGLDNVLTLIQRNNSKVGFLKRGICLYNWG
jgi:hypothetical protein